MSEIVDLTDEEHELKVWINRRPLSKPSVRMGPGRGGPKGYFRMFTDNEARREMNAVKEVVQQAATNQGFSPIPRDKPVKVTIWCMLKRPTTDFASKKRGIGRLKACATCHALTAVPVKPDNDNLAKLLLDAVKGVLYEDDAQVVNLQIIKLRDNEGLCEGRIAIQVGICKTPISEMLPNF